MYSEGKIISVVCVPEHLHKWIAWALNTGKFNKTMWSLILDWMIGAGGIIIPCTETLRQVQVAVDATRFPPLGCCSFNNEYKPNRWPRGRNCSSNMSDWMLHAMDNILMLSMLLKGTTPQLMATERQRWEEVEELCVKEASQVKVQQWMQSLCILSYLWANSY